MKSLSYRTDKIDKWLITCECTWNINKYSHKILIELLLEVNRIYTQKKKQTGHYIDRAEVVILYNSGWSKGDK